jgi:hypothetical protein
VRTVPAWGERKVAGGAGGRDKPVRPVHHTGRASSRLGWSMLYFLVTHLTLEHFVCSILKLTKSWRLAR